MSDVYYSPTPQNPPPGQVLRLPTITVRPENAPSSPPKQLPEGNDPWGDITVPTSAPQAASTQATSAKPDADPWGDITTSTAPATPSPAYQISPGGAVGRGAIDMASFGLTPTLAGLSAAGAAGKTSEQINAVAPPGVAEEAPGLELIGEGMARVLGSHPDPAAQDALKRGREAALADRNLAQEQYPLWFLGGQFLGGMMTPGFGAGGAGTLGARLTTGAIAGGVGSGLYGVGSGISAGQSPAEIAAQAPENILIGAGVGSALKGTVGPRAAPQAAVTSGQRAAATSAGVGSQLPRGVTSDRPWVQDMTARLMSTPFENISEAVKATESATGEHIGDIASTMTSGVGDRSGANVVVESGLQQALAANKQAQNAAFDNLRSHLPYQGEAKIHSMPRSNAVADSIAEARRGAGWSPADAEQGMERVRRLRNVASFNGAQRLRSETQAIPADKTNPGFPAGDVKRMRAATTADMRDMVKQGAIAGGARDGGKRALQAFEDANRQFGKLAKENEAIEELVNAKGEGALSSVLAAATEKKGDVRLLAQLRGSMPPQKFAMIGGTLLRELGQKNKTGEFSLNQFVTNWNKVSDRAKGILFDPAHLQNIEDIVGMGAHAKGAMEKSNKSYTSHALLLFELIHAGLEGAFALSMGAISPYQAAGAATVALAPILFTRWLASPAKAASMAAWSRAYGGFRQNPTPARRAVFNVATRNLANNLGLDPAKVIGQLRGTVFGEAESEEAAAGGNRANPHQASR